VPEVKTWRRFGSHSPTTRTTDRRPGEDPERR